MATTYRSKGKLHTKRSGKTKVGRMRRTQAAAAEGKKRAAKKRADDSPVKRGLSKIKQELSEVRSDLGKVLETTMVTDVGRRAARAAGGNAAKQRGTASPEERLHKGTPTQPIMRTHTRYMEPLINPRDKK